MVFPAGDGAADAALVAEVVRPQVPAGSVTEVSRPPDGGASFVFTQASDGTSRG
jgi:hypothetical protein